MKRVKKLFLWPLTACCLLVAAGKLRAQDKLYPNAFPLADVKLLQGPFRHARDLNIKVLLQYDVDRLLAGYRKEAGLPEKAKIYPNWDGLDGHIAGHYLSSVAINYAATGNTACKKRMEYMLSELMLCQNANGKRNPGWAVGYVGAAPGGNKIWGALQEGDFAAYQAAWVPWYNVHKMYAGLRDAWVYAGHADAKTMFLKFCDWAINLTTALTDTQMQTMLDIEHGGMNEIFADAYQMTQDEKYLVAAKRFSHKMLLDAMAAKKDNLDNKHANTQVPKIVGMERIGELAKDNSYKTASAFFWETVTTKRSLAFGGNSRREFFPAVTAATDFINEVEGPESCNSYNMLKLTEGLFRINPLAKYTDYYEKALYNHILSTQHPGHGGYVYFTPSRPRHYRVYSSPNQAMWCCVGSGMENHGKYGQFIYTRDSNSLYLNLFIASELNWQQKKIKIKQQTDFPNEEKTTLTIIEGASRFSLKIRYPSWVKEGRLKISVNGKDIPFDNHPSSYIAIERLWRKGDVVTISLPMHNRLEQMPDVPNYMAFMHGPILLAAKTGTDDLKGLIADDSRWAHIASGKRLPVNEAPIIVDDNTLSIADKLKPIPGKKMAFLFTDIRLVNPVPLIMEPFYKIHDARYMMYWMTVSKSGYRSYLDSLSVLEKEKLDLHKRTVDFVAPGEQQPEADHFIQKQNSNSGHQHDEFWRDARDGGYFSYELSTANEKLLSLRVRYWGAEWGNRKFEIYIDDKKLTTEDNTGKWNQSQFQNIEYPIPDELVAGKNKVTIKFQSLPGNTAGAVYYLQLLRKKTD